MLFRENRGFTLIELMVALAVAVIITTIAVPGFRTMIQNNRASTQANELLTALMLARAEAVKRGAPVSVCASANQSTCAGSTNWATGWIVFTDSAGASGVLDSTDQLIRVWESLGGAPTVTGSVQNIRYLPSGLVASGGSFTFTLPDCKGDQVQTVTINAVGSGRVSASACP